MRTPRPARQRSWRGRGPRWYGEMPAEAKPVAVTGGLEVRKAKAAGKDSCVGAARQVEIV